MAVLNALRHQRFGTRQSPVFVKYQPLCSTPYGIRGLAHANHLYSLNTSRCAQRLTASEVWHQAGAIDHRTLLSRAQRLTASEVWHSDPWKPLPYKDPRTGFAR